VSQLGKVSEKFSTAVEVAAGPRMKSIVVEDDKIAAECIAMLKQAKAGIATFLPLNKVKARINPTPISGKGVHGNALDLITFDKKFKDIFSFVFGNTYVIEDVETARRIGIGRARMATLDGDLMEVSGAMIGGFRQKIKGLGFQQKEVTENISKLKTYSVGNGAALVLKSGTGEILAMVGSQNFFDKDNDGNVNVTVALRQPGSSIKPVNYATALERKLIHF